MFSLILFYIDGTLIHSGGAGEKAFAKVCGSMFNVPNGTAQLRFAGRTDTSIVREFFTQEILKQPSAFLAGKQPMSDVTVVELRKP